jgi:hypothetical protein
MAAPGFILTKGTNPMKHTRIFTAFALLVCLFTFTLVAHAQAPTPTAATPAATAEPPGGLDALLVQLAGLAGAGSAISLLINVGKSVGIVKDGTSQNWSAGLNLVLLIGLLAANVYKPGIDLAGVDKQVSDFVQVGVVIFTYILQLAASKAANQAIQGVPVAGKSFASKAG